MGMPRGSKWKRLAVFSSAVNADYNEAIWPIFRAHKIEIEWWERTVKRGGGKYPARNPIDNLGRDASPTSESWLMVRRGDWPLAFVLAKDCGVRA